MSKQPEDKEALSKQLDELKKDLADFEADGGDVLSRCC
jgi:hypothetical protein